jgi:hypothetical protein
MIQLPTMDHRVYELHVQKTGETSHTLVSETVGFFSELQINVEQHYNLK